MMLEYVLRAGDSYTQRLINVTGRPQRIAHGLLSAQLILNARKYMKSLTVDASGEWGSHPLDTLSLTFEGMRMSGTHSEECMDEIELI